MTLSCDTAKTRIAGADVLLAHGLEKTEVWFSDDKILHVGSEPASISSEQSAHTIDARGLILAPALIDVHGDAFEKQIMPRPGVGFPVEPALLETDRQLAANGITTAYHALTLSWEPGLRSVSMAQSITNALTALEPRLCVDNRIQLRWESFAFEACEFIAHTLSQSHKPPTLAFNDHTSMEVLHPDTKVQHRPFEHRHDYPLVDLHSEHFVTRMKERSKRSGLSLDEHTALFEKIWSRRSQVPETINNMASLAREHGVCMFSHDDSQIETRAYFHALGANVAEFPMRMEVAEEARANDNYIVFGAPNVVRGKSHLGSPSATHMISEGLCDVLASDYFYPSMLTAIANLVNNRGYALHEVWPLVSSNAAKAVGLQDRGSISSGMRADLVLIEWPDLQAPVIRQTFCAGRMAYAATPSSRPSDSQV